MSFRLLSIMASVLVAFALPVESRADSDIHFRTHHGVHHHYCCPRIGGYRNFTIVGPNYWAPSLYDTLPPSAWSDTRCYPGFYNCQTFWERVNTQRNYPVQY
ncbi:MAG: hypothetical protein WCD20_19995 [Rhodomicrobium sp.]